MKIKKRILSILLFLPYSYCTTKVVETNDVSLLNLPTGMNSTAFYEWQPNNNLFIIKQSCNFSSNPIPDNDLEGFYWMVPSFIHTIQINAGVTVTGGFRVASNLSIIGEDRSSSHIYGTATKEWALGPDGVRDPGTSCNNGGIVAGDDRVDDCNSWKYSSVSSTGTGIGFVVNVANLTIENSRTYAVTSLQIKIHLDNVYILNSRPKPDYYSNSDGFAGGFGSSIKNSKIDTWDDAIKLYQGAMTVENVTIVHNSNGAPFQLGWQSDMFSPFDTINNVLVCCGFEFASSWACFFPSSELLLL